MNPFTKKKTTHIPAIYKLIYSWFHHPDTLFLPLANWKKWISKLTAQISLRVARYTSSLLAFVLCHKTFICFLIFFSFVIVVFFIKHKILFFFIKKLKGNVNGIARSGWAERCFVSEVTYFDLPLCQLLLHSFT